MSNPFAALAKRAGAAEQNDERDGRPARARPDGDEEPVRRGRPIPAGQQGQQEEPLHEFTGTVLGLKVYNDWGRAQLALIGKPDILSITGTMVAQFNDGDSFTISARLKHHPKYGSSYDVVSYAPHVEPDPRSLIRFISKHYKGIGDKTARAFVDAISKAHGEPGLERLRQQLVNEPWAVDFSIINKGSKAKFDAGEDQTDRVKTLAAYVQRDLALKLRSTPTKVLEALAVALVGQLNDDQRKQPVHSAWAALSANPYKFVRKIRGWGFGAADSLAREVGLPMNMKERLAALVDHAVDQQCAALGHQYLTREQVRAAVAKVDPAADWQAALNHGLEAETVVLDDESDVEGQRIYPRPLYLAEVAAAKAIAKLMEPCKPLVRLKRGDKAEIDELRQRVQATAIGLGPHFRKGLDESQIDAVVNILTARVRIHTVTAKPGSGKTAVTEVVAAIAKDKRFSFCSPTGKGAKVLNKRAARCGYTASTVHSLLQGSEDEGFAVNKNNPLETDVNVVDEAGMPGIQLAQAALEANNDRAHLVLLGDYRQLQSVPPGNFLRDLLRIKGIDHNELTIVHRNSGGIAEVIDQVDQGVIDCVDRPGVTFSHGLGDATEDFELIKGRYLEAVAKAGIENVALLMSRRKGELNEPAWNTTYANQQLRDACNPTGAKVPGTRFFLEDRIIIRANMDVAPWSDSIRTGKTDDDDDDKVKVVNGDTGRIAEAWPQPDKPGAMFLKLMLDDGRAVCFPSQDSNELDWSYALTVHSAQGSEYKEVLVVATPGSPNFVNRTSLFTGLSRAVENLQVFGNDSDLRKIAATPAPRRNSALVERVMAALEMEDDDETPTDVARDTRRAA